MYPRLIWEESGRAISLCLPLSYSLSCSLSSPTISSLLSFLHSPSSPPQLPSPPPHFLAFSSPTPVCLPFPFVLLMSFNLLPPVFPPSLIFLASIASFSFFQLSLPFLSLFSLIWTPFSDPLPPHLSSTPACPSLPLPPSPGFRCSHDFSPSLFQAPPPRSPLSIIINDKG